MYLRAACIAVLLASLSACGGDGGPAVSGVVGVNSGSNYANVHTPDGGYLGDHAPSAACIGAGQNGDAQPGALVTFFGADNNIVGTAKLEVGHMQTVGNAEFCVMPFESKLNKKSDAYQAQFGQAAKATVDPGNLKNLVLNAS